MPVAFRHRVSQYLCSVIVTLAVVSACSRETLAPDRSSEPLHPLLSLTASGYVLVSQLDSMSSQALSFGRSLQCPAGKRILGGGVQNANSGVVIQESAPNATGDSWAYTVSRDTTGTSARFTGWAVCADSGLNGYVLIARTDTMASQAVTFGRNLSCSAGKEVVGGGVQNGTHGVVVQETHPLSAGTGWAYTVSRKSGGTAVTFTGRAICADSGIAGYTLVSRPDSMGSQMLSFGRSLVCPVGKSVFSGGVQNANYGLVLQENHPDSTGGTWAYTVSRPSGGSTVSFTGWAICATVT
jgi:hypothetical protein